MPLPGRGVNDPRSAPQRILRVRRSYNQFVADETLEDYALRFTAKSARRFTPMQIAMTALGGISFLALEAIGGTVTLSYGVANALPAIACVAILIFLAGLPISFYAAKYGVDIDLLTRGAGFGYLGSTVTSLIYASFTFIFLAIEAAIMAMALKMTIGLPLWAGYIVCAVAVIPIVTHGIALISRFQTITQPIWVLLNVAPFVALALAGGLPDAEWAAYTGTRGDGSFDILLFGGATAILFALTAQLGEQVDFLRFMPRRRAGRSVAWWTALIAGGPGWIIIGTLKILAGSMLAVFVVGQGLSIAEAHHPTVMYLTAYEAIIPDATAALWITGLFVVIAQMKINVTNAYAGSIAWSNFFSRLTHSHPGRVVWVIFNVAIAVLLMEMGILQALEEILALYAILAVAWVAPLVADLVVNKPLGLSPAHIEFKRAHLYDINPVGFGAMGTGIILGALAHVGLFGELLAALSVFVTLIAAFVAAPAIAYATDGRYYLARRARDDWAGLPTLACCICEHEFEREDMASCPAYAGPICSLCCTLDARCNDLCKTGSRAREQIVDGLARNVSTRLAAFADSARGHYLAIFLTLIGFSAAALSLIYLQATLTRSADPSTAAMVLAQVFVILIIFIGIASWVFVLAHESRRVALEETRHQTGLLTREIEAHRITDAELQRAKEKAEAASLAKTRFVVGMSHELRTPLNSLLGFAQILDKDTAIPEKRREGVKVIRRSGEHLAGLIDGLLDISRIEAGKLEIYRDEFALGPLLSQIVEMFRLQAGNAGIGFVYRIEGALPDIVRGDAKRTRQILINLLSNAIKFTREGQVTLTVRYRSQIAEFAISDTGPGIAEEHVERVFEPFERIEDGAARPVPGMGLGLTITKLLAEILGGDVRLASTLGVGSTFTVRLMLATVVAPVGVVAQRREVTGYRGERRTVLVVDDEPVHRQLVEEILTPIGFTVLTADGGETGLRMARLAEPDLVILDVSMPGQSGWEVAERIAADGIASRIVMLSADARPQSITGPIADWVSKPLVIDTLLDTIARTLGLEWLHDDEPAGDAPVAPAPVSGESDGVDDLGALAEIDRSDLQALVEIGHVRGINAKLDEIARRDPGAAAGVAQLRLAVERMDFDAVETLLAGGGR